MLLLLSMLMSFASNSEDHATPIHTLTLLRDDANLAGSKDASAYFSSVCTEGGYEDFSTDPHSFVQVPAAACASAAPKARKERSFQA
jgi:hypothetical protein